MGDYKITESTYAIINKFTYFIIILLIIIFLSPGCPSSYDESEQKGYYQSLVQRQHDLNKEDTENIKNYFNAIGTGEEPLMKYYFEINEKYYYVLKDVVFSIEGSKITNIQLKSEGYFTNEENLYYVYGEEREKVASTIGGPVGYTLKDYKYRKLNLTSLEDTQITKEEYEKLYFELSKILND